MSSGGGISASVTLEEGSLDASLARIRGSLQTVAQQINALNVQFAGGGMTVEQYVGKLEVLEKAQGALNRQSKSLEQQIRATNAAAAAASIGTSSFAVGLGGAAESTGRMTVNSAALTRGIVDLSRGFEDFTTGGFLGVLNNLPGMTMNLAMGFGVAAEKAVAFGTAVSIIATASFAAYKNWGQLQALLGTGMDIPALKGLELMEDRLKTLDKRIEELRGKGKLSLPELGELNKATDERTRVKQEITDEKAFQGLTKAQSSEEEARGSAFAKAVKESGGMAALDSLVHALEGKADDKGRVGVLGAEVGTPQAVAKELFLNASRGSAEAFNSIIQSLPGSSKFRDELHEQSPETKAARDAEDRAAKEVSERAYAREKRLDDRVKKEADVFEEEHDRSIRNKIDAGHDLTGDELISGKNADVERYVNRKIQDRRALTPREEEGLTEEMKRKRDDLNKRDDEQRIGIDERIKGLREQRFQLMNPERQSQRMGLDQYDTSIAGMTGLSEESKRLDQLIRLNQDLNQLMEKRSKVGAPRPR